MRTKTLVLVALALGMVTIAGAGGAMLSRPFNHRDGWPAAEGPRKHGTLPGTEQRVS
jgi:hypothetical protein